jgi:predicted nucleotidyltransferase
VSQLAAELDAPERTLRRAVALGAVRSRRLSARRLRLADSEPEPEYLRDHWGLVSELRGAFRTEPRVRHAVLFGSMARGDDDISSDVDLLVNFREEERLDRLRLASRIERRIGREVDVANLKRAERRDPLFLLQALDEGRVMVDRDGEWASLLDRRPAIYKRAMRSYRRQMKSAAAALDSLTKV